MKLKKEYIILPVIIAALVLYLVLHKSDRTHYTLPHPDKVAAKQIDKIEIKKGDHTIGLIKKDDAWLIGEKAFPANRSKTDKMLDVISDFTISALVSESENYTRYELDAPQKITVKAFEGNTLRRAFDLGKEAATFQHTFVKLPENPNVYHARGNFRSTFDQTVSDLRDKVVLTFKNDDIKEIVVKRNEKTIHLKQKEVDDSSRPAPKEKDTKTSEDQKPAKDEKTEPPAPKKKVWESTDGEKVKENEINNFLRMLSHYECNAFMEDKTKEDLTAPLTQITLKDAGEHTLTLFAKLDKDAKKTPAITSANAYPFFLSDSQVDNLNKKIDVLIEPKPVSKEEKSAEEEKPEPAKDVSQGVKSPDQDTPDQAEKNDAVVKKPEEAKASE